MTTFNSQLCSIATAITTSTNIEGEVNNLLDLARNEIGLAHAMQEWMNVNVLSLPILVEGTTLVKYKDDRGNTAEKEQSKNLTFWVIALNLVGLNNYINKAQLAGAFQSWAKEEKGVVWNKESAENTAMLYINAMQEECILATELVKLVNRDGEYAGRGNMMADTFNTTLEELVPELRERASMKCRPLAHQPANWTDLNTGVGEFANIRLIKDYMGKGKYVAEMVLQAVNKLQGVRFVVAPCIYDAAKDMTKNAGLFQGAHSEFFTKKELTSEAFDMYSEMKALGRGEFYFPVTMDQRGRMYYRGGLLTPQGQDFCKAAFQFAEYKELGADGFQAVCIHTANVFGMDKVSINERIQWVQDNMKAITACKTHRDLRKAFKGASTFQALVAAHELARLQAWVGNNNAVELFKSNLVCHQDGTCNGLQHMAAITGDRETAIAVNCVASTWDCTPSDVYGIIATEAAALSTGEVNALIVKFARDMAKNPVMITGYGAGEATIKSNTGAYLLKKKELATHANTIGELYIEAIGNKAGAVTMLTQALKACVEDAMNETNKTKYTWKTADGFMATTEYRLDEMFRIRAGNLAIRVRGQGKAPIDAIKTVGAMSPNFVHSIDATHLRMVVNACNHDLVTVHDSIGSHACNFFTTATAVRECFVKVHAYDALEDLCKGMKQEAPIFEGDYKAEEALKSSYIFS